MLVVNPTHVAVAILYERDDHPVPTVTAKAEESGARAMREAAGEAHVPVLRNERLARLLLADVDEGDPVPRALFDVVAEIILWAQRTRERIGHDLGEPAPGEPEDAGEPPGEDLTEYPPETLARVAWTPPLAAPDPDANANADADADADAAPDADAVPGADPLAEDPIR